MILCNGFCAAGRPCAFRQGHPGACYCRNGLVGRCPCIPEVDAQSCNAGAEIFEVGAVTGDEGFFVQDLREVDEDADVCVEDQGKKLTECAKESGREH